MSIPLKDVNSVPGVIERVTTLSDQLHPAAARSGPCRAAILCGLISTLCLLLILSAPSFVRAAVLEPLTLEQLAQRATTIVVGTISGTATSLARLGAGDSPAMPQTLVNLDVLDFVKGRGLGGAASTRLTIPVWGGTVGGLSVEVDGMPVFVPGETCIVFLDEENRVIGGGQGKLDVAGGLVLGLAESLATIRARIARAALAGGAAVADGWADEAAVTDGFDERSPAVPESVSRVGATAAALVTPVIIDVTPDAAPAGTGDTVTVRGTGFGTSPGKVEFFYKAGQPGLSAPIVSWTDTAIVAEVPVGEVNGYWASASSGPVTVTNAGGLTSVGHQFWVTFGYGQVKWPGSSVGFRVNPNCADTTQERALIDAAAASWSAPADFQFIDSGTCSTTSPSTGDDQNDIFWSSSLLPSGVLATAWTVYFQSSVLEVDICFNDTYAWGDGSGGTLDVQTVALHEMGHWLKLRDLYGADDTGKVMYGYRSAGMQLRELSDGDRDGVVWIYGFSGTPQVDAGDDATVTLGSPFTGSGSFYDPDDAHWTATVDYGDGTETAPLTVEPGRTFALSHVYGETGVFTVTVRVTDGTGATGSDTLLVTVDRVPVSYALYMGTDRFDTAIKLSKAAHPQSLPPGSGLVLAPGETYQEALCGAPLAAAYGGPVLLTPTVGLNNAVRDEIVRLAPDHVICIGLSDDIKNAVQAALGPDATVSVIRGTLDNVYDMSYKVAGALAARLGGLGGAVAMITRGDVFPDAIGVSPLACARGWPILLTNSATGALHSSATAALTDLGVSKALKVGTYVTLPDAVTGLANLSGADRYETNRKVAEWAAACAGLAFTHLGFATGDKFPDALASGPYFALDDGVLLLSPLYGPLPACIGAGVSANADAVSQVSFIAMIEPVIGQVKALLQ